MDQNQVPVRLHRFDQVRIGREVFHNVGIGVADIHIDEAGLLLGVDYLRTRRVWLSYATRQMIVMPAAAAASFDPAP